MRPFVDDLVRRERDRALWNGGIIATAFVAAGAALAMSVMPPVQTPANVARAYVEAKIAGDWAGAWALTCTTVRSAADYPTFAARAEYANEYFFMPSDVDIEVGELRGIQGPSGPSGSVAISMTSDERNREDWVYRGEVLLVEERAGFRVCTKTGGEV